ncbi:hypothetical protein [Cytophaga aurantiaca]|uniref:hypothetical protein n=1 Tax=Cytophaga aurantiaca TaxID=29530 RepID=UPI0003642A56|nr:hypothetical protein [Cytophaga aurantiaca]
MIFKRVIGEGGFFNAFHLVGTLLFVVCIQFSSQAQVKKVKVSKHQFLLLYDTVIVPQNDTIVILPKGTKYKKRRDYKSYLENKYIGYLWGQVYREEPLNLCTDDSSTACESKNPYLDHEGKYIRNIYISKLDVFGKHVDDTVYVKKKMIDKFGDALHEKTKTFVIRDNLFIKHDSIVDQNRLSDNERLLRTLNYMHDARIYVREIPSTADSVDIEVIVQDIWTLGGSINPNSINYYQWKIYDQNFLGMGQSLEYKGQLKSTLSPNLGSEFTYSKNNLFGTFLNPYFRYSQLNGGAHVGMQNETSITVGISRAIYMPTARLAGGYVFSNNWSVNTSKLKDTAFYDYEYNVHDVWGGITFSRFKRKGDEYDIITRQNRARIFFSMRYYNREFLRSADQYYARTSSIYNDQSFILGQATYFKYDYYKTKYVYGFGRTEDIPYGHSYLLNTGVEKKMDQVRYYFGANVFKIWARPTGLFYFIDVSASSFYNTVYKFQDIFLRGTGTLVTRIYNTGRWKHRFYLAANYTKIVNPQLNGTININGANGLYEFNSLTLVGYQASSMSLTANVFPPFKLLGFRFAFIALAEVAQIGSSTEFLYNNKPYSGFAAGFRTKNENLALDEFELRVYCFPNAPADVSMFKIVTLTSPRLRINIKGVGQPGIIGF